MHVCLNLLVMLGYHIFARMSLGTSKVTFEVVEERITTPCTGLPYLLYGNNPARIRKKKNLSVCLQREARLVTHLQYEWTAVKTTFQQDQ